MKNINMDRDVKVKIYEAVMTAVVINLIDSSFFSYAMKK